MGDFNINEWELGRSQLADALQRRKIMDMMKDPTLKEAVLMNQLKEQALAQNEKILPVQLQQAQANTDTTNFNLQRGRENRPLQNFIANVDTLGSRPGAQSFLNQYPQDATKMFQPSAVPMSEATGTLPEVAERAAGRYYNLGPELSKQLGFMGESLPLSKELIKLHGDQSARVAGIGIGERATEHKEARSATAAGQALQNFTTNPAMANRLPVLESMAAQAKNAEQAKTVIQELDSTRSQIRYGLKSAQTIGSQMGGPPDLMQQLEAMANDGIARIDKIHRELYNKYWGPESKKEKSSLYGDLRSLGSSLNTGIVDAGSYLSGVDPDAIR